MSRVAGGGRLLGAVEKEAFLHIMRRLVRFGGVGILTFAVMRDHFHLLVRVPDHGEFIQRFQGEGGEERLLEHLSALDSRSFLSSPRRQLAELREMGATAAAEELPGRFLKRLCSLEHFMKELKERDTRWCLRIPRLPPGSGCLGLSRSLGFQGHLKARGNTAL